MAQFLSKPIADFVVYLAPPDYHRSSNPPLSTAAIESVTTTSNLLRLEFEQTRVRNKGNRQLFTGVFIVELREAKMMYQVKQSRQQKKRTYSRCA
jgi:hypothetical protein